MLPWVYMMAYFTIIVRDRLGWGKVGLLSFLIEMSFPHQIEER